MSFLKSTMIISIMIIFIIFSGCVDEETSNIITDPTPTPTPTLNSTALAQVTATPIPIITDTPRPTPTPKPTARPIDVSDGSEIPWCAIKSECDTGIRNQKSEICVSVHEMPKIAMDDHCGLIVWTGNESAVKPARNASEQKAFDDEYGVGFK